MSVAGSQISAPPPLTLGPTPSVGSILNLVESYLSLVVTLQNLIALYVIPCWRVFGSQVLWDAF